MKFRALSVVLLMVLVSAVVCGPHGAQAVRQIPNSPVVPMRFTDITADLVHGHLTAHGVIAQHPFTTLLTLSAEPEQVLEDGECPMLSLELRPIHLDLVEVAVDTNTICVDITAQEGDDLLGAVLCTIANYLSQGLSLTGTLHAFTSQQLDELSDGLTALLNAVLAQRTTASATGDGSCDSLPLKTYSTKGRKVS